MDSGDGSSSNPQRRRDDEDWDGSVVATAMGVAAGAALMGWGFYKLISSSETSDEKKMMKAPGRDYYMPRGDFEEDPASYFRDLR
ncbi:hypothetical protein NMG60_11009384, partial [Bertholletia excelsa]